MAVSVVRFFWATGSPPRMLIVVWTVLTGSGLWWIASDVVSSSGLFAGCLYLQMFAVSSGFLPGARAGHFDPVLGGGTLRVRSAMAHWVLSSLPGVIVWAILGTAEWLASGGNTNVAFLLSSVTALALVSTIAWLLTLPFSRWAGAVMWTASLVAVASSQSGGHLLQAASIVPATGARPDVMATLGTVIFCPFLLLTSLEQAPARADDVALAGLAVAWAALSLGVCLVAWRDYPLDRPA